MCIAQIFEILGPWALHKIKTYLSIVMRNKNTHFVLFKER